MTLIIADRIKETCTTTGTGALTLAGAMTGFKSFASACAVGDTAYYAIQAVDGSGIPTADWEVGLGTYSAANTLTRTTVLSSSNSNAAVDFSAGTKQVWLDLAASHLQSIAAKAASAVTALAYSNPNSHRAWRLLFNPSEGTVIFADINFRTTPGTVAVMSGGTILMSTNDFSSFGSLFNGLDNDWAGTSSNGSANFAGYDYGAGASKYIAQVRLMPRSGAPGQSPTTPIKLQYSDDNNVTWTDSFTFTPAAWVEGVEQIFTDPNYAARSAAGSTVPADVLIASPADGQLLRYDAASGKWKNGLTGTYWNEYDSNGAAFKILGDSKTILVATIANQNLSARANSPRSTGKYYFEFKRIRLDGAGASPAIGLGTATSDLYSYVGSSPNTAGQFQNGQTFSNGAMTQNTACVAGDIVGVAVDFTAGAISFYRNNTANGSYTGLTLSALYPMVSTAGSNFGIGMGKLCTKASECAYTPPSGYSYWDA